GGLAARVRGAAACGAAAANGLDLDRAACHDVIARCRAIADRSFANLLRHPGSAECFRRGRGAGANRKGFHKSHPKRLRVWLRDQIEAQADGLGLPLPVPATTEGVIDRQLRNWPVWALGTEPLVARADLQTAEFLGGQLGQARGGKVHPKYHLSPRLGTTSP